MEGNMEGGRRQSAESGHGDKAGRGGVHQILHVLYADRKHTMGGQQFFAVIESLYGARSTAGVAPVER